VIKKGGFCTENSHKNQYPSMMTFFVGVISLGSILTSQIYEGKEKWRQISVPCPREIGNPWTIL